MNKLLLILLVFSFSSAFAQEEELHSVPVEGRMTILEKLNKTSEHKKVMLSSSKEVDALVTLYIRRNDRIAGFEGYRIQLFAVNSYGVDVEKLKKMRDDFETQFKTIPAYLRYTEPDFKLTVGNYVTKMEAVTALGKLKRFYPGAYIVKSKITLADLERVPMQDVVEEEAVIEEKDSIY